MRLGRACKEETPRMKNVSIESSGGKKYVFVLRKTVYSRKNSYIIIIIIRVIMQRIQAEPIEKSPDGRPRNRKDSNTKVYFKK
jgi:hypothetical protein